MSFWASSYSYQLESLESINLVPRGPVRVKLYDDCKDTRCDVPRIVTLV